MSSKLQWKLSAAIAVALLGTPALAVEKSKAAGKHQAKVVAPSAAAAGRAQLTALAGRVHSALETSPEMHALMMLMVGNSGNTYAHMFLEEEARSLSNPGRAEYRLSGIHGAYQAYKDKIEPGALIVKLGDESGLFIHANGDVEYGGKNIGFAVKGLELFRERH